MLTLSLPCVMKSGPEHTANSTIQSKSFQAKRMPQIIMHVVTTLSGRKSSILFLIGSVSLRQLYRTSGIYLLPFHRRWYRVG